MQRRHFMAFAAAGTCVGVDAETDQPLAPWTPGGLDIHHIATGRGNATLVIQPDGASLLIDAGAMLSELDVTVAPRPSAERRAGEWIARYVQRHLKPTGRDGLDSLLVTHLHPDHLGDVRTGSPQSARGPYRLSGVTDVADALRVGRLVDRGYPTYDNPSTGVEHAAFFRNYLAFVESWVARGGRAERFVVGSAEQLGVHVRNIAANGQVWTGQGDGARTLFPPLASLPAADRPSENLCSAAVRISSGPFSYFTGGDLINEGADGELTWRDMLTAAARACGPVDVATADHHGLFDALNPAVVRALRPQAWVVQAWHVSHPSPQQLDHMFNERFYPGRREVYATNLMRENLLVNRRLAMKLRSTEGHVVIRVAPGGESFRVIVTSNADESDRVKMISEPFRSRGGRLSS